ncbi:hypothetical protein BW247_10300 [Acidihalobacter ferrooxydans]|uniref:UPF0276 protein BW247_10300 n=1 Tax=Acidihalobacter ferrooxydans TaxID=1765967 RepID=A0A1P8ULG3_9GAMM|nr:hypothetical protein BW247_10300 [Acidihalobacter ferrooxydans]
MSADVLAGIGLRAPHHDDFLSTRPAVGWVEVHSENFFVDGGPVLHTLDRVRADYPVSLHGVGLGLGSAAPLSTMHLDRLQRLIRHVEPLRVSEHLCWGQAGDGRYVNDLLPLPYTEEALRHVCARVDEVQERLGCSILIENLSAYLQYAEADYTEWAFLAEVARRSGCGILLDINNLYVNAINHGFDAHVYLAAMPPAAVGEIHLAGFSVQQVAGREVLIDTHSRAVSDAVWALYDAALARLGGRYTLIEWDNDLPPLATLLAEAEKARTRLEAVHAHAA